MLRSMCTSSACWAMTPEIKRKLERIVRSGQTEQRMALRARIVLGAAGGKSNNALAKELETSRTTVIDWRQRFAEVGVAALYADRPRGRSFKPLARAQEAAIITRTLGRQTPTLPPPFYSNLLIVAEPGGALVRKNHRRTYPPRYVHKRSRARTRDLRLHRAQCQSEAFCLDKIR